MNYYLTGCATFESVNECRAMQNFASPSVIRKESDGNWTIFDLSTTPRYPNQVPFELNEKLDFERWNIST